MASRQMFNEPKLPINAMITTAKNSQTWSPRCMKRLAAFISIGPLAFFLSGELPVSSLLLTNDFSSWKLMTEVEVGVHLFETGWRQPSWPIECTAFVRLLITLFVSWQLTTASGVRLRLSGKAVGPQLESDHHPGSYLEDQDHKFENRYFQVS